MSRSLRSFIRHAERYGSEFVYEAAAAKLGKRDLNALARRLAAIESLTGPSGHTAEFRNGQAVCSRCSEPVRASAPGRPRRYCSAACRQAAYRARST